MLKGVNIKGTLGPSIFLIWGGCLLWHYFIAYPSYGWGVFEENTIFFQNLRTALPLLVPLFVFCILGLTLFRKNITLVKATTLFFLTLWGGMLLWGKHHGFFADFSFLEGALRIGATNFVMLGSILFFTIFLVFLGKILLQFPHLKIPQPSPLQEGAIGFAMLSIVGLLATKGGFYSPLFWAVLASILILFYRKTKVSSSNEFFPKVEAGAKKEKTKPL